MFELQKANYAAFYRRRLEKLERSVQKEQERLKQVQKQVAMEEKLLKEEQVRSAAQEGCKHAFVVSFVRGVSQEDPDTYTKECRHCKLRLQSTKIEVLQVVTWETGEMEVVPKNEFF